jgi:hypothetical protein
VLMTATGSAVLIVRQSVCVHYYRRTPDKQTFCQFVGMSQRCQSATSRDRFETVGN